MSLMIFKAFLCVDTGGFIMLAVLVSLFGLYDKTASDKVLLVVGACSAVLSFGTIISGTIAFFWWWAG